MKLNLFQVFIGIVRPTSETFINESALESYRMEYRTRHSIDGEIIQCDSRIALVTGYMTHEVSGVNAMNFMHRDDVRWVIIALRESKCLANNSALSQPTLRLARALSLPKQHCNNMIALHNITSQ